MRKIEWEELKRMPDAGACVNWVLPWVEESLFSCFRFLALELEPFEKYNSDGGVCLLASGKGSVEGRMIAAPCSFGFVRLAEAQDGAGKAEKNAYGVNGEVCMIPQWFRAEETCVLLCLNTNIFDNVCFGMGCGAMHTRLRSMILDADHTGGYVWNRSLMPNSRLR